MKESFFKRIGAFTLSVAVAISPAVNLFHGSMTVFAANSDFEAYMSQQGFPESYKAGLRKLHQAHPTWNFKAVNTGLSFDTVVAGELQGTTSLVSTNAKSSWKSTDEGKFNWTTSTWPGFDGASWVAASKDIIAYYVDPRNFLDDQSVFQFAEHSLDLSTQTLEGIQSMVAGTFLQNSVAIDSSSPYYSYMLTAEYGITAGSGATATTETTNTVQNTSTEATSASISEGTSISFSGPTGNTSADSSTSAAAETTSESTSSVEIGVSPLDAGTTILPDYPVTNSSDDNIDWLEDRVEISDIGPGSTSAPGSSSSASSGTSTGSTAGVSIGTTNSTAGAVSGTGIVSNGVTVTIPYAYLIYEAATTAGMNPYVLAAMILQEQGKDGHGGSIQGTSGYYNYLNIGAYASGNMTAVERGLWYAAQSGNYNRPWNTPEKAIVGGAMWYADNYLKVGQNTLYLKRFNVTASNTFKHQYMTNIQGACEEGKNLSQAYSTTLKSTALTFYIPIYSNMPETPAPLPTGDGNPNNRLATLNVSGFTLTPTFSGATDTYTLIVDPSVTSLSISATPAYSGATVSGTGNIALTSAMQGITITVKAQNGSIKQYTVVVAQQTGGQLPNGTSEAAVNTAGVSAGTTTVDTSGGQTTGPTGSSTVISQDASGATTETTSSIVTNMVQVGVGPV